MTETAAVIRLTTKGYVLFGRVRTNGNHISMRANVAMATTAIATISSIEPTAPNLRFARHNGGGKCGSLNSQTRLRMPAYLPIPWLAESAKFLRTIDPSRRIIKYSGAGQSSTSITHRDSSDSHWVASRK